jgi:septal ring factor EnvC (AmiA/AmiB activator)
MTAGLGLGLLPSVAAAAAPPDRDEELQAVRQDIVRLRSDLEVARSRSRSLSGRLREVEIDLELAERRVREASLSYEASRERVAESESGVVDLESRLSGLQASLRTHVLALQAIGRQRELRLLLAMNPEGDLLDGVRQLRFLARRDVAALEEYEEVERRLLQSRRALAVEEARLASWLDQEEERRAAAADVRQRQGVLAAEANRKRRQLESRAAGLRAREERLARMIDLIDSDDLVALQETSIAEFKGVLDWPLPGEVITDFGPRLDPRYRTRVPHNGIEISVPEAREVSSVYAGTVVFAAPFQGYGLTAVVRHAGGVMTLYAGLESMRVAKDDVVSLGDVLGTATGQLYFEFREGNRAVDPLDWLR